MEIKEEFLWRMFSLWFVIFSVAFICGEFIIRAGEFAIQLSINLVLLVILFSILKVTWMTFFGIYQFMYYRGPKFQKIKTDIKDYVQDCNELNEYIEELKDKHKDKIKSKKRFHLKENVSGRGGRNYKKAYYEDYDLTDRDYRVKDKKMLVAVKEEPYKYLCKYFTVKKNQASLEEVEDMLNDFSAVEEGKLMLESKFKSIKKSTQNRVPFLIYYFGMKKFMDKVGFDKFNFKKDYYPTCKFIYITPGNTKMSEVSIPLDVKHLNEFLHYLSDEIGYEKSAKRQRALMTPKLRKEIKERDMYTCQNESCGVSIYDEPTLLLEIDHKIPISKGGLTTRHNLQTLCWRCNRSKGSKTSRMFMLKEEQLIKENEMFIAENETLSEDGNRVATA